MRKSTTLTKDLSEAQKEAFRTLQEENVAPRKEDLEDQRIPALKLIMEVATRWSSTLHMIERALVLRPHLDEVLLMANKKTHRDLMLFDNEWTILTECARLLRPFAEVVQMLEGQKYVTLSLVWPCISLLKEFLSDGEIGEERLDWTQFTPETNALRAALLREISAPDRFANPDKLSKVATLLDPRYLLY